LMQAIRSGGQPPIPYDQLVDVTRATFTATQSLRAEPVVKIDEELRPFTESPQVGE